MTTLSELWKRLLFFITGNDKYKPDGQEAAASYAAEYADKSGINLLYIACNKIANYAVTDSTAAVTAKGENTKRAELLNALLQKLWRNIKLCAARALGSGKYAIFPYYDGNAIELDFIDQAQIRVIEMRGAKPVDIVVLCEKLEKNKTEYLRLRRYKLKDKTHIISEIYAVNGQFYSESPLAEWEAVAPLVIENVDRLLFGAIDCPIDARNDSAFYRAKLTDGADEIIADIASQLQYLEKEYRLKESRIFVSDTALGIDESGNRVLTKDNIYAMLDGDESAFEVFNPEIRADPIFKRLKFSLELLEKQIGVSQGIFSTPESLGSYMNSSNIKRAVFDTYALVTDFRANIRACVEDVVYSANAIADVFGITPRAQSDDYEIKISWSSAMIEDMATEWEQYKTLAQRGAISDEELRKWVCGA